MTTANPAETRAAAYRFVITSLLVLLTALLTMGLMDHKAVTKLQKHEAIDGHPVMVERVHSLEENQKEIKEALKTVINNQGTIEKNQVTMYKGLEANRELKIEIMQKLDKIEKNATK